MSINDILFHFKNDLLIHDLNKDDFESILFLVRRPGGSVLCNLICMNGSSLH